MNGLLNGQTNIQMNNNNNNNNNNGNAAVTSGLTANTNLNPINVNKKKKNKPTGNYLQQVSVFVSEFVSLQSKQLINT